MMEGFVPSSPGESQPMEVRDGPPGGAGNTAVDDPRALTILTTEHWGLLSARSLVYNEAFARAGMFLALLSATLVGLGLISTATGFSDEFLVVAAVLLALDLFVGLASLGRISAAVQEDIRYLQGMNRLRHAYDEMVPGLEKYVIGSKYDDFGSVVSLYGQGSPRGLPGILHGFTTTPGMIRVICCAVSAGLAAVLLLLFTHAAVVAGLGGLLIFAIAFAIAIILGQRWILGVVRSLQATFPRPDGESSSRRS